MDRLLLDTIVATSALVAGGPAFGQARINSVSPVKTRANARLHAK
jgi:hypothetical protein